MQISADFYGGNIAVVTIAEHAARLRIRPDPVPRFCQWFYFRVDGDRLTDLIIENAGEALVPAGWPDYQAFVSFDGRDWSRAPTAYRDGALIITHAPRSGPVWYAYFPPYPAARHQALLERCRAHGAVSTLCATSAEDEVALIELGSEAPDAPRLWAIGRQHSGEVQASWWMEGFIHALLAPGPRAADLLARARVSIAPNMNPSGSRLGLHRANEHGVNLNASWAAPPAHGAAAVQHVLARMGAGVDFCLDVHGDEELPYAFAANVDRLHPAPPAIEAVRARFQRELAARDGDFRVDGGYTRPHTVAAPLGFCGPQIISRFQAPALTLELPYKTVPDADGSRREFGPAGCLRLGRACVAALHACLDGIIGVKRAGGAGASGSVA
jgi:murein tripeptide amidase MpaA